MLVNLHGSLEWDTFGAIERCQVQADVTGPDALPDGSYYRCVSCPCLFYGMALFSCCTSAGVAPKCFDVVSNPWSLGQQGFRSV